MSGGYLDLLPPDVLYEISRYLRINSDILKEVSKYTKSVYDDIKKRLDADIKYGNIELDTYNLDNIKAYFNRSVDMVSTSRYKISYHPNVYISTVYLSYIDIKRVISSTKEYIHNITDIDNTDTLILDLDPNISQLLNVKNIIYAQYQYGSYKKYIKNVKFLYKTPNDVYVIYKYKLLDELTKKLQYQVFNNTTGTYVTHIEERPNNYIKYTKDWYKMWHHVLTDKDREDILIQNNYIEFQYQVEPAYQSYYKSI